MIRYKLLEQDMTSHGGMEWKIGKTCYATGQGNQLCSKDVLHSYETPEIAVFCNPIHSNIDNPRLFECETGELVADDGLKGGHKWMTALRELPLPVLTMPQRVEIAIRCTLVVYQEPSFVKWANDWIDNKDRTRAAAESAARSAESAESAARSAESAESAAWSAASAARSAESAAWSAASAARSAESAESVAWSAASAARSAERSGKLFNLNEIIKEVLK